MMNCFSKFVPKSNLAIIFCSGIFCSKPVSWHLLRIMHVRNMNDRIQNALWILIPGKEI